MAKAGTLSGAASELHTSVSALSAAMNELERAVGTQLLVRRKARGIQLTPAGQRFLGHAQSLVQQATQLAERAVRDESAGTLRLGCYGPLAPALIPRALARLVDEFPRLQPVFVEGEQQGLIDKLATGELDVALLYQQWWPEELASQIVARRVPYVLVPKGHRWTGSGTVSVEELAAEPMVLLDVPPSRENTLSLFSAAGVVPNVRWVSQDVALTRALVGQGLGVAVLLQPHASDKTVDGREVETVSIVPEPASSAVHMVWRATTDSPWPSDVIRQVLAEALVHDTF